MGEVGVTPSFSELADLVVGNEHFEKLTEAMDVYCPFEALNVSNYEIRHSAFLCDLLNPTSPHGIRDRFLREFLDLLCGHFGDDQLRLRIHLADLTKAEIRREWKNMDLFIRTPLNGNNNLTVVVEMKISAPIFPGQLTKYRNFVQSNYPDDEIICLVLAPEEPEMPKDEAECWKFIAFEQLVDRLEKLSESSDIKPELRMMMEKYCAMMRRKYLPNRDLEEIAAKLWREHGETLDYLISQRPDLIGELRESIRSLTEAEKTPTKFSARLNEEIYEDGVELEIKFAPSEKRYLRINIPAFETIDILQNPASPKFKSLFLVEIMFEKNRVRIKFLMIEGDAEKRSFLYEKLKEYKAITTSTRTSMPEKWASFSVMEVLSSSDVTQADDVATLESIFYSNVSSYLCEQIPIFHRRLEEIDMQYKNRRAIKSIEKECW